MIKAKTENMPAEIQVQSPEVIIAPPLGDMLNAWDQRINRLSEVVDASEGKPEYPQWWVDESQAREIRSCIRGGEYRPEDISQYFDLYQREVRVREKIDLRERDGLLGNVIYDYGADVIAEGFVAEGVDGPLHQALVESLTKLTEENHGVANAELQMLQKAYGLETITQVLGIKGGDYETRLHDLLISPKIIKWIRYNDQPREDEDKWADIQAKSRVWMSSALESATGITHKEAMDYAFSASRRGEDDSISDMIRKFDHFGIERIRRITEATGIVGLETYTVEQLERMDRFATDPEGFAASLKDHDVSVLLVNRVGDHNGVMSNAATEFDDVDRERMLFFEIASASDILRVMATLNKRDIKPSTLVLSAHSSPGKFVVSDERMKDLPRHDVLAIAGRKMVAMANGAPDLPEGLKGYSMHGMKGVARIVEDYMTPSKGIDDASSDVGRKKIIFQACHAGAEIEYNEPNENGEKVPAGTESVVSQLGKDLVVSGVVSNVDIYGAPDGIQMHRTSNGIRYSGQPVDFDNGRTPLHAVRISIDRGTFTKSNVDEIPLRELAA